MIHHPARRGRGVHAITAERPDDAALRMRPDTDIDARVLVVDDDPLNTTLLTRLLASAGYRQVDRVTDSWDAVRRVRSFEPDVVLLDLNIPNPDGFEILRQISAMRTEAYLPVLVVTGDPARATRERALSLGAADCLTKPYFLTETLLRVRNLILIRRRQQELQRHARQLEAVLEGQAAAEMEAQLRQRQVTALLDDVERRVTAVYQPIVALGSGRIAGAEALARFDTIPYRPPGEWFAEATEIGLGTRIELAAIAIAIDHAADLPDDAFLSLNLSPSTLRSPALPNILAAVADRPVVIELTARESITDYQPITDAMGALRRQGARFAVDDNGSGFSGLSHTLQLAPELIKLDLHLVRGIDRDPARRAMARALVHFAAEIGAELIAVGIETVDEFDALRQLGVAFGQGYVVGRPQLLPFAEVIVTLDGSHVEVSP